MTRETLITALINYQSDFAEEMAFRKDFLALLEHPRSFFRDHLPGHITGSSWIVDTSGNFTLLTHHAKLNRWLQPGGHADGEEDVFAVALREAQEETGLQSLTNAGLPSRSWAGIFDIDIHIIPARKDFAEHQHYDIRFLLQASMEEPLSVTEESHALAWKAVADLPAVTQNNLSMLRMAAKAKRLF
jgi:8-oxo-dGTP pyrophosphatase MutT (NUDIX family)